MLVLGMRHEFDAPGVLVYVENVLHYKACNSQAAKRRIDGNIADVDAALFSDAIGRDAYNGFVRLDQVQCVFADFARRAVRIAQLTPSLQISSFSFKRKKSVYILRRCSLERDVALHLRSRRVALRSLTPKVMRLIRRSTSLLQLLAFGRHRANRGFGNDAAFAIGE